MRGVNSGGQDLARLFNGEASVRVGDAELGGVNAELVDGGALGLG